MARKRPNATHKTQETIAQEPTNNNNNNTDSNSSKTKAASTFGKTADGTVFKVPSTSDVVVTLFTSTQPYTIFEGIVLALMFSQISLYLFTNTPKQVFLAFYIFWRLGYNVLLGVLLRLQSNGNFVVRWCKHYGFSKDSPAESRSRIAQWLINQLEIKMGPTYKLNESPDEFNAWIIFRGLVDVILVNDVASYIIFCFAYNEPPAGGVYTPWDYLRIAGGVVMCGFNVWVKSDAHRVVKDFAWYWGDFFFLIEASLVFDGVFELAPHPMYSVGYMWYYGASLISSSYTVLFTSLWGHALQFAFLHFVENPHIEKTYNTIQYDTPPDELRGYLARDLIGFANFDWFRSTDLLSVGMVCYSIFLTFAIGSIENDNWKLAIYIGHALIWRFIHTYLLGAILHFQSKNKFFTRHFIKHGERPKDAFSHWKSIYNICQMMLFVSFFICVWRVTYLPSDWTYGTTLLRLTFGVLLIMLHCWTSLSIHEVIGDLGWFYGDFFIASEEVGGELAPRYTGIYRFLNNPEKIMGQASFWGATLISNSAVIFALTLFGQVSTWLFLKYVEGPHMAKLYGMQVREYAGVENMLRKEVKKIGKRAVEKGGPLAPKSLKKMVKKWEDEENKTKSPINAILDSDLHSPSPSESDEDTLSSSTADGKTSKQRQKESPSRKRVSSISDAFDLGKEAVEKVVTKIATAAAPPNDEFSSLPTHLYSVTLVEQQQTTNNNNNSLVGDNVYELGQPIKVSFKAPVKYLKSRDWIGIYKVTANKSRTQTTSMSLGKWWFVTGINDTFVAENEHPINSALQSGYLGKTKVTIEKHDNDNHGGDNERRGNDILCGELTFRGFTLPWESGSFEFRFHSNGKYHVLGISQPFEIVLPKQPTLLLLDINNSNNGGGDDDESGEEVGFVELVDRCIDVTGKSNTLVTDYSPLSLDDDILEVFHSRIGPVEASVLTMAKQSVCSRITYLVKQIYGVEFSWKVISFVGNTRLLESKIREAQKALQI